MRRGIRGVSEWKRNWSVRGNELNDNPRSLVAVGVCCVPVCCVCRF